MLDESNWELAHEEALKLREYLDMDETVDKIGSYPLDVVDNILNALEKAEAEG
ncbi:hypothetical protein [uncultured Acidaminococcus sp.]|uniref:hypothetical protein n=1 Tax=uncultured Acidaminococcus sp. TaxID=352152 RepID=UPI00259A8F88|nr:hypothetical protein [uncultured Acidaminococcus sp.]